MNKKLNLLYLNYEYPPIGGGGGTTMAFLARKMVQMGHRVYVITAGIPGKLGVETVTPDFFVERLNTTRTSPEASTLAQMLIYVGMASLVLKKRVEQFAADLVHIGFGLPTGAILPMSLYNYQIKKPYIVSLFGGDVPGVDHSVDTIHSILRPMTRALWQDAAYVVPNSYKLGAAASQTLNCDFPVITNGVDVETFHPNGRRKRGILRLLFAGRLRDQKGLDLLLKALSQKRDELPDWRLTVVGDGPLRDVYANLARELQIDQQIDWPGWVPLDQLPDIYRTHDIFILPSRFEGMPSVVLQAMASGCAILSTDVFGVSEIVANGKNGIIVEVENVQKLAEGLVEMSQNDRLHEMQSASVEISLKFSWQNIAEQYERLYLSALNL